MKFILYFFWRNLFYRVENPGNVANSVGKVPVNILFVNRLFWTMSLKGKVLTFFFVSHKDITDPPLHIINELNWGQSNVALILFASHKGES